MLLKSKWVDDEIKEETIQMTVYAKQKQSHRYRKQTCGYQGGVRRGEGQIRVWY